MDGDGRSSLNRYSANYHQSNPSSHRMKPPLQNTSYNQQAPYNYSDDSEDDDDDEGAQEEDEVNSEEDEDEEDASNHFNERVEDLEASQRYSKKRKWKKMSEEYEFSPRSSTPSAAAAAAAAYKPSEWTEHSTIVLLDVWGDRLLQLGRKSLRSEEWQEVAKKVSQMARTVRTDTQCRYRLDTLKKKYKKERMKLDKNANYTSNWVYFKKLDMLMSSSSSSSQQSGLACGFDAGEYVFTSPNVYLNRSIGLDEMMDSPENSESSDDLPPKKARSENNGGEGSSFRLLADSIQKFGDIYERIEENKRQHMRELEKMRMEFHKDLELQKRQILEHAQAEIEKIQQSEDEDNDEDDDEVDVSVENASE